MVAARNRSREEAERTGHPGGEPPRTDEQKARDRQTALIWGAIVVAVPGMLVLLYLVTR